MGVHACVCEGVLTVQQCVGVFVSASKHVGVWAHVCRCMKGKMPKVVFFSNL